MEIGDLFYIIILSLFMILGFFNDSRKKKNEQKQQSQPKPDIYEYDEPEIIPPLYKKITPPNPKVVNRKSSWESDIAKSHVKEGHTAFQSSMQFLTDFDKESSLKNSIYVNDTGETYMQDTDSQNRIKAISSPTLGNDIVNDLTGDNSRNELVKALIYSEIIKRKY
ncbi:MAG: hypothetical protein ITF98_02235 [Fermentimonas sp.]|nr:hypothetical protein [Fermentimonas sp.]